MFRYFVGNGTVYRCKDEYILENMQTKKTFF